MDNDFYKILTDAHNKGIENGILQAKIAIVEYLLYQSGEDKYKTTAEIAQYILNMTI